MTNTKYFKNGLLAGAAAFAMAAGMSAAHAEDYTTGTLKAVVQNEAGTIVPNATVIVTSNKGVRRTTTTDSEGRIRLPQLPVGQYTVTIEKDGYETLVADKVMVLLAGGSFTFTVDSQDTSIEEIYVVGTRQGSWDFNTTTTGISVNVNELFERTPIARSSTAVALLAPGTSAGDSSFASGSYGATGTSASFNGSSVAENAYYVNGLNITNFRNAIGSTTIPFEFIDQLQVKTGGYQAEFGRSTGGVVNAVTKSGSNDFHFGANVFWEPNALYEDAPDTFSQTNHMDTTDNLEYNFWASGAIVKDKLFFYGMYNPRSYTQTDCGTTSCTTQTKDSPFYGLKIDFVPFDGHRLEYTFLSDNQDSAEEVFDFDKDADAIGASKGVGTYHNGGANHIFKYTGALTDWFTISAMYGENNYDRAYDSPVDTPIINEYRNGAPGSATGDWVISSVSQGKDKRKAYRIDGDLYFNALGDHHIRFGWDQEKLTATEFTRYSGNIALRYYTTPETGTLESSTGEHVRIRQYWNQGDFETTQSALYIQDSWQVLENLTLNIGFRNETFDNKNASGDTFVKSKNQNALRLGFSWDPANDGKNRIYGFWGRYYLPIATNTNIRMAGSEFYVQQFYELPAGWDQDTPYIITDTLSHIDLDAARESGQLLTTAANGDELVAISGITVYGDGSQAGTTQTTDVNLKPMYQDEWILGAEHQFDNGWSVGIRFVHRKLGRLIEDVAIDAAVIDWADENGYDASAYSGFHQYVLTNPGQDMTVTTNGLLDSEGNNADQEITLTAEQLGYPQGKRSYNGIDLTFSREWDGKWSLEGSYTWSKSKGNTEGSVKSDNGQDDAGLTTDFDQPGLVDGAYGYLPNDRRHRIKLWGNYAVNDWLNIGGLLNVSSPRKFGCIGDHPTDAFAAAYGAASWYCNGELTPRGSQLKSDWLTSLDLSFSVTPEISNAMPGDLVFRVDVFNVFNSSAVTDIRETGELGFGSGPDTNYGKPSSYQTPRHIRFSANYAF